MRFTYATFTGKTHVLRQAVPIQFLLNIRNPLGEVNARITPLEVLSIAQHVDIDQLQLSSNPSWYSFVPTKPNTLTMVAQVYQRLFYHCTILHPIPKWSKHSLLLSQDKLGKQQIDTAIYVQECLKIVSTVTVTLIMIYKKWFNYDMQTRFFFKPRKPFQNIHLPIPQVCSMTRPMF